MWADEEPQAAFFAITGDISAFMLRNSGFLYSFFLSFISDLHLLYRSKTDLVVL